MTGGGEAAGAYARIAELLGAQRCVVLDGGTATELARATGAPVALDERSWGTRALLEAPDAVLDVHGAYVAAGCDVISTDTWGLPAVGAGAQPWQWEPGGAPASSIELARRGLGIARQAVAAGGREDEVAVAFALNGDIDTPDGREAIGLLARLFADGPRPDLILVETLSVLRPSLFEAVEELLATGLPLWLSFRRCRHGLCGAFGEHWGGPEGDALGRAARRFEELGVGALLVNCIPPDHVDGVVSYLRDFTDMPLGAYPNLGYLTDEGWRFEPGVGGDEYARLALRWREEGAQIVGGCCGVGPEHVAAARAALEGTRPGRERREPPPSDVGGGGVPEQPVAAPPWTDLRGRRVFPLPYPDLVVDPGVQAPREASFMAWSYLFREGVGAHERCLDLGCGTGVLGIQLALNGAAHVRAIDIDRRAVANTLTNAFRNRVDDRLSATAVDVHPWVPEERFDVIVAGLSQAPVDPLEAGASHRVPDYWGRNLLDQLIVKLPEALAPDGVAYLVQLSILSQQRTAGLLAARGYAVRVVDYVMFRFRPEHEASREQIERVEGLSDAYHLRLGDQDAMVAYLLEVRAAQGG